VAGFMLDLLFGDPVWLPHPVRLFGWIISRGEALLNKGNFRRLKGAVWVVVTLVCVWAGLIGINKALESTPLLFLLYSSIMLFYGVANRGLISEALKVEKRLQQKDLDGARIQLSRIVGRDTSTLHEKGIRKATLETLSENLSDGVIAPLFYYLLGGIPLLFAYKLINTFDSMIGYRNERYLQFGWFAARVDDLFNFLPARITALLMAMVSLSWRGFGFIWKYGSKHTSPNAGYPEAALAGILNCQLGGPAYYQVVKVEKPFLGEVNRTITHHDMVKACYINLFTTLTFLIIMLLVKAVL
jgi:adenosylcobinamide-phosphate synthase